MLLPQTGSLNFDGIDDYIEIENTYFNTIDTGDFTIEAWINGNSSHSNQTPIILSNRSSDSSGIMFYLRKQNNNYKNLAVNISGEDYTIESNISLGNNYCNHIAVTRKKKVLSFFKNGYLIGTREIVNTTPSVSNSSKLYIGKDQVNLSHFKDLIEGIRIWNIALTQTEISKHQLKTISGNTPNLIGYWDFKTEAEQSIIDLTGNNKGQLGNSLQMDSYDPIFSNYGSAPRVNLGNDTVVSIPYYVLNVKNPDYAKLIWSDGTVFSSLYNQKHFTETGTFKVEAINRCGISYDKILIKSDPIIYVPNVFTPANNSYNENFGPCLSIEPKQYLFRILNQNKQIVFESRDSKGFWDGNYNNIPVSDGIYIWYILLIDEHNETKEYKGTTLLLR